MKKQYQQPDMEVVAINGASQMLAGSVKRVYTDSEVELNPEIKPGTEPARSDEYYDMDDDDLDW
ncbi:MAG: hypothetical protein II429_06830 [Prevotella sp.]|nr:hypothetical protein [Prevotella sp.]